jgi:hypothetical protein
MKESPKYLFLWRQALRESGLPTARKCVLHTLSDYMDMDGLAYAVSVERLGREAGMMPRAARRHLTACCKSGWLAVVGDRRGGRSRAARYRAALPETWHGDAVFTENEQAETRHGDAEYRITNTAPENTKPGILTTETRHGDAAVLISTLNNSQSSKSRDIARLVDAFADEWVKHSSQTSTVRDPVAMKRWVLKEWGSWARERYAADSSYRPSQLVDKARALGKVPSRAAS